MRRRDNEKKIIFAWKNHYCASSWRRTNDQTPKKTECGEYSEVKVVYHMIERSLKDAYVKNAHQIWMSLVTHGRLENFTHTHTTSNFNLITFIILPLGPGRRPKSTNERIMCVCVYIMFDVVITRLDRILVKSVVLSRMVSLLSWVAACYTISEIIR